jgi:hypothetical protein
MTLWFVGGIVLHIALGALVKGNPTIATIHAVLVICVGLFASAYSDSPLRTSLVVAYIAGSETLWRMAKADIWWEFGKYAVVFVLLVALVRQERPLRSILPIVYFALLIPAGLVTLLSEPWGSAKDMISFNLSGPLSMMICSIYFFKLKITGAGMRSILLAIVMPLVTTATFIALNVSYQTVVFSDNSSVAASGGFGPNQVSTALGCGAVGAFLLTVVGPLDIRQRLLAMGILAVFVVQSILTFSRAGVYYSAAAIGVSAAVLIQDKRYRISLLLLLAAFSIFAYVFMFPRLEEITGGTIANRYADRQFTGRENIIRADIEIFKRHPVLGIGAGRADAAREEFYSASTMAHTEYTRLLSEHGLLGFVAAVLLCVIAFRGIRLASTPISRAILLGLSVFGLAFMIGNGMRLVLPSVCIGLAQLTILADEVDDQERLAESGRSA